MALDAAVASILHASRRNYGRPRIVTQLRLHSKRIEAERVWRSLLRQQLRLVYKRPYRITTDSTHCPPVTQSMLQ